jgi:hypothetical protein
VVIVLDLDLGKIHKYCAERFPLELLDRIRLEATVRGRSVTIFECRPPWREDIGPEWTRHLVAQMRYDVANNLWTLYWSDRNARWHVFDLIDPGSIGELLDEIELDQTAIF